MKLLVDEGVELDVGADRRAMQPARHRLVACVPGLIDPSQMLARIDRYTCSARLWLVEMGFIAALRRLPRTLRTAHKNHKLVAAL